MNKSLQGLVVGLLAVIGVAAVVRNLGRFAKDPGYVRPPEGPKFQLDVLAQEAAVPGKIIHAKLEGKDLLNYTCTDQDAAIAVFTMRDLQTHAESVPHVVSTLDPEGHGYSTRIISEKGISILIVRAGFSKRPSSIEVILNQDRDYAVYRQQGGIKFTKIAEPRRVLSPPSPKDAAENEKFAKATVDDATGQLHIRPGAKYYSRGERVTVHVVGTSYSNSPLEFAVGPEAITYFGAGNDAVKVRLDRYRYEDTITTLTYKNASIVQRGGQIVLLLPSEQEVGSILGIPAILANLSIPRKGATVKKPGPPRGEIRLTFDPTSQRSTLSAAGNPPTELRLERVLPSLEQLGLETVRVMVIGNNTELAGFDTTLKSSLRVGTPALSTIPEFKLMIRVSKPTKVSSKTVVLPVHRVK